MAEMIIEPLTRIYGNAGLRVQLDEEGRPQQVRLQAYGYRGFEQITEGTHIDNLLPVVSRVCGGDSVFHQAAAAIAVERALGVEPAEGAGRLRELAMLGQLFERHAVSLTVHSVPDLLFPSSDPGLRNIISINRVDDEVVKKLLALKQLGTCVLRAAGGKAPHPVNLLPGGAAVDIAPEVRKSLIHELDEARPSLIETARLIKLLLRRNEEVVNRLGTHPTPYLACKGPAGTVFQGTTLQATGAQGEVLGTMSPDEVAGALEERNSGYSHIRSVELSGVGNARVGPLARLNVNGRYGTPQADEELEEIKAHWGFPVHRSMMGHAARILEMIHAWERMKEILAMAPEERLRQPLEPAAGRGSGVVEAPEGTLLYDLEVSEDGLVSRLSMTAPLQFNLVAMESSLAESALVVFEGAEAQERAVVLMQTAVRAYAPCIPCGIH